MITHWTEAEITTLKQNWTVPPNMQKLIELIHRSTASIYEHARELHLPTLSYSETYNIRHVEETALKQKTFLEEFREQRNERRARLRIKLSYQTIRKWIRDSEFARKYKEVQSYILSTKKCVYCHKIGNKDNFRSEKDEKRRNWGTGICLQCNSKRAIRFQTRSMESRIRTIWKYTKTKRIGIGRNTATISDLTLNELMELYKKQNGLCYYTGTPMIHKSDTLRDSKLISLDRRIPENGYTIDNVVFCCWGINNMKSKLPHDEFIAMCKLIANRFN